MNGFPKTILAAAAVAAAAGDFPAAAAVMPMSKKGAPVVTQQVVDGRYAVEGSFVVKTSSAVAWSVLSDYDEIGEFVTSIRRSVVKERRPDSLIMEQVSLGQAFFLSKEVRVLLEVREKPFRRIEFSDISNGDFEIYRGSWALQESAEGVTVVYRLEAKPRMKTLRFVGKHAFNANVRRLLSEVRDEILRRTPRSAAGKGSDFAARRQAGNTL